MESAITRALYDLSPMIIRNLASSVLGWTKNRRRLKGDFDQWLELFRDTPTWTVGRLLEFQSECLRMQVEAAYNHTPFWRKRFDELGLTPASIQTTEDLDKLPILEKTEVVASAKDIINRDWNASDLSQYTTSGSTGTPLAITRPNTIEQMEWAFLHSRNFLNQRDRIRNASFTGLELISPARQKPPFWIDNWANRQRMFSIFHLNDQNLPAYVDALDRHRSEYIVGYPSAIYTVAEFMKRRGLRLTQNPKYIVCGSEELQPHYEETIREVFGAEIRNRYGQNEMVGSITLYDCGHLHYDMEYSILEFEKVEDLPEGEVLAEVIGTNMHDHAWPLIRYRTGDLVVFHPDDRCDAGRSGQIIRKIHGRTGRYFTLPNGSRVTNISVIAKKCTRVRLMQVVQKKANAINIRVVRDEGFTTEDQDKIISEFRKKIGNDIEIDIEFVEDIQRTQRGKYISIINEVDVG